MQSGFATIPIIAAQFELQPMFGFEYDVGFSFCQANFCPAASTVTSKIPERFGVWRIC